LDAADCEQGLQRELKRLETYEVGKVPWWVMVVDLPAK
jgi:hypothetical protein